jgi:hypothetical protein
LIELSWFSAVTAFAVSLAGLAWLAARIPWRIEAHRARALDGSAVSQLELRLARRSGETRGWRLYCSIVLARGADRPPAAIPSGQPPARGV